VAKRLVSVH